MDLRCNLIHACDHACTQTTCWACASTHVHLQEHTHNCVEHSVLVTFYLYTPENSQKKNIFEFPQNPDRKSLTVCFCDDDMDILNWMYDMNSEVCCSVNHSCDVIRVARQVRTQMYGSTWKFKGLLSMWFGTRKVSPEQQQFQNPTPWDEVKSRLGSLTGWKQVPRSRRLKGGKKKKKRKH